jgi:hypothetical protein
MQRSTQLKKAGILIIVASCLALVASLFMAFFTWAEYFVPSHLGSVRVITEPFYVVISIIIFELFASVLGLTSALNTFKARKLSLSLLGATFLLIAGLLFFTNILFELLPHVESFFGAYSSNGGLLPIYQLFAGLPMLVLASVSIILLVSRRKEFSSQEINPSVTLEAILILCSITSASFVLFSIVPYEQARGQFSYNYPVYNMIVNAFTFMFASIAAFLVMKKKYFFVPIVLMIFSLLSALSLPFIFNAIFPWIGSFVKGLVRESPIIILSAVALILAFLGRRNGYQSTTNQQIF